MPVVFAARRGTFASGNDIQRKSGPAFRRMTEQYGVNDQFSETERLFKRETEQNSDRRRRGRAVGGERSKTALSERFDDSLGFDRINGVGAAKIADALAGHTPREMARAAVSVLNLAVRGNAKTFSSALMSFNLRHLRPFVSIKVA